MCFAFGGGSPNRSQPRRMFLSLRCSTAYGGLREVRARVAAKSQLRQREPAEKANTSVVRAAAAMG